MLDCQLRVSELRDLGLPGLLSACRASNTPSILANTQVPSQTCNLPQLGDRYAGPSIVH